MKKYNSFLKIRNKNITPYILNMKEIFVKNKDLLPNDGHAHINGNSVNSSGNVVRKRFYKNISKF